MTATSTVKPRSACKRKALLRLPVTSENDDRTAAQSPRKRQAVCRGEDEPAQVDVVVKAAEEAEERECKVPECPAVTTAVDEAPITQCHGVSTVDVEDLKAFISLLPPLHAIARPPVVMPNKPAGAPKVSLVLDLDETLVHSSTTAMANPDFVFPVQLRDDRCQVHVRMRPHCMEFLEQMSRIFEVTVFTASQKVYAEELLDQIDPTGSLIHHRLYRDSCVVVEGNYLKDLSVMNRDLNSIVIVDNSPVSFSYQLENGVPIESWFSVQDDDALLRLVPFLRRVAQADDVRSHVYNEFWLSRGEAKRE